MANIFGWFKSWFARPPAPKDDLADYSVYRPRRLLYTYSNGKEDVSADPMRLYRQIMEVRKVLHEELVASCTQDGEEALKAHESAVARLVKIFGLKTYAEGGLTDGQIIDLFNHFVRFCNKVRQSYAPVALPEDSPPADSAPPNPPPASAAPNKETVVGS